MTFLFQERIDNSVPDDVLYQRYEVCEEETEADETVPQIQIILVKPIEGQSLTLLRQIIANQAFVFTDFCPNTNK